MKGTLKKSEKLLQAINYETEQEKLIRREDRPAFHVVPPVGWMNDPNGLSEYQGEYHLFYQYHPYNTHWGPMHWGHYKTRDFIRWELLPCAMAPDMDYDGQGCFSGSAVEYSGRHILMYTGVKEEKLADGSTKVYQTQCIAVGDGVQYEKLPQNPVIGADMLPAGSSQADFRDPRIWREGDCFYSVVGSKNEDGSGQIALFSSQDARTWKYEKMLDYNHNRWGKMWECPDFFPLEDKQLLFVSPQFMTAEGLEFHNGNNAIYFVGSYDREKKEYTRGEAKQVDYGMDFYAPQTLETKDGRRIMIGWLQSWDNYLTPDEMPWSGFTTIPRELSLNGDRIRQVPVRELENYRRNRTAYYDVCMRQGEELMLKGIDGRSFDMTVELEDTEFDSFTILLACDGVHRTALTYDRKKGTFTTDRTFCGMVRDLVCSRSMYVNGSGKLKLRILMDKYTIEVFVNDGEQAMTSLIYTPAEADQIRFSSEGNVTFSVTKYDITVD